MMWYPQMQMLWAWPLSAPSRHKSQRMAALVDNNMGDVFYHVCHGISASISRLHGNAWRRRFALASPASAFFIKSYSNASG